MSLQNTLSIAIFATIIYYLIDKILLHIKIRTSIPNFIIGGLSGGLSYIFVSYIFNA